MNKLYIVNKRVSETPVYWTARYKDKVIDQIDDQGVVSQKWSALSLDGLEYWGIVSNIGCYGFYPKDGFCDLNGVKLRISSEINGKLKYKRTVLASSEGWTLTKSVEIGFGSHSVCVNFVPNPHIVFSGQQELTGQDFTELESKKQ